MFSGAEKLGTVSKADACLASGKRGALEVMLRQEGLYSSLLSPWRGKLGSLGATSGGAAGPPRRAAAPVGEPTCGVGGGATRRTGRVRDPPGGALGLPFFRLEAECHRGDVSVDRGTMPLEKNGKGESWARKRAWRL